MPQQTYSPFDVSVTFLGNTIVQLAKGTFVEVDRDSNAFEDDVGAKGDVVRIRSSDKRGTIKLTTQAASPSNDVLTAIAVVDEATALNTGAVFVKDARGTSLHHAESAWIRKLPKKPYATEASNVEWEIRCAVLEHVVGGTLSL